MATMLIELLKQQTKKLKAKFSSKSQKLARNNAIDIAKGEYIVFVDPDDWMEINALEKIYNHFKKTNANVIQFNYIEFDEQKFNVLEKACRKYAGNHKRTL